MAQKTKRGAATRFFRDVVASHAHPADCIIWPFARNNSGRAVFGKRRGAIRSAIVSRVVCSEVHGFPPEPEYEAAHTCGNGHLGCINPRHLEWKTSKDNKADQLEHGTRNSGERNGKAKLTVSQVLEIRSFNGSLKQRLIAERFGIDPSAVSDIINRHRWGHIQ